MLIQTKTTSKLRLPLLVVLGILAMATIYILVRTYASSPDADLTAPSLVPAVAGFKTNFQTKVLDDVRLKGLRMHGPAEVQVQERGQKADPFQPF
ncbi:MAG: hypothetical protein HY461_02180 [Parcubacteria group bacterium]|nr:hypothetical protein [Parcubacteria group bacterium]